MKGGREGGREGSAQKRSTTKGRGEHTKGNRIITRGWSEVGPTFLANPFHSHLLLKAQFVGTYILVCSRFPSFILKIPSREARRAAAPAGPGRRCPCHGDSRQPPLLLLVDMHHLSSSCYLLASSFSPKFNPFHSLFCSLFLTCPLSALLLSSPPFILLPCHTYTQTHTPFLSPFLPAQPPRERRSPQSCLLQALIITSVFTPLPPSLPPSLPPFLLTCRLRLRFQINIM